MIDQLNSSQLQICAIYPADIRATLCEADQLGQCRRNKSGHFIKSGTVLSALVVVVQKYLSDGTPAKQYLPNSIHQSQPMIGALRLLRIKSVAFVGLARQKYRQASP